LSIRIVFLGTAGFAVPALERLIDSDYELAAIYTQPDRPAGRGRHDRPSPVKEAALRHGLLVRQPLRLSTPEETEALTALKPDVIVTVAYGQILHQRVLDVPPRGVVNIHPSLLPRYRGAAPIAGAILAGEKETGVTIMLLALALDEGPILSQRRVPIDPHDTTGALTAHLAGPGAELLMETLPGYLDGSIQPQGQDPTLATYVPMVQKEDGLIDWRLSAVDIWRRVRAFDPWPTAYTHLDGELLQIREAWPVTAESSEMPGTIVPLPDASKEQIPPEAGFAVQTGDGLLAVLRVQKAGRRAMAARDFLRGERGLPGKRLESRSAP